MYGFKKVRRFVAVLMAVLVCTMSFSAMAFAKESVQRPDLVQQQNGIVVWSTTMTTNFAGSGYYSFDGNSLHYNITVTGSNGQPVDKYVRVELHTEIGRLISGYTVVADGATRTVPYVSIEPNAKYYFDVYLVQGDTSNLNIRIAMNATYE